jgi:hypothetical protein
MTRRYRTGVLLVALVALLALAPSALARGGGGDAGGGGASCAQILQFSNTPTYTATGDPGITTSYTVQQGCVDEFAASVSLIYHNDSTGFTGTQVNMTPLGTYSYSNTWASGLGTRYTITLNVYAPNGKLVATQKQTVTSFDQPQPAV